METIDEVRRERDEFLRVSTHNVAIAGTTKAVVELDVAPFGPTQLLQSLSQHRIAGLSVRVGFEDARNDADPPHPLSLLCARRERPRHRAAEKRDERAALHSITSSARASSDGGTSRPSMRAVWALMTSSNLAYCSTGRSVGLAPLRMRPTYTAICRYVSTMLVP
jgi:hypothetical protein